MISLIWHLIFRHLSYSYFADEETIQLKSSAQRLFTKSPVFPGPLKWLVGVFKEVAISRPSSLPLSLVTGHLLSWWKAYYFWAQVAHTHTCKTSYLVGWDQGDCGWKPAQAKSSWEPHLQNNQSKIDWKCGLNSRAPALQAWRPEFITPGPRKK
jgi:hypothetical protein